MQKYKIIKELGNGSFGIVYKATNTITGETVAIKKFKQKYTNWDECIELRQVKSLRKLNHRNIIKLKEALQVADEFYMVFEYLEYNLLELYDKCKKNNKRLTENQIRNIVHQVASGLASMHKSGFFHRDMKPQNLLIYNNIVKICDFGLAREIRSRPPFTEYVSTRWYRAPQLLLRSGSYNSPVDIFALGCIMAELYMQEPLFPGKSEIDQLSEVVKVLGTPDMTVWPQGYKLATNKKYYFPEYKKQNLQDKIPSASPEAIDLMEQMLQYQSRKRPTALEILKHPYFDGYVPPIEELQSRQQIQPIIQAVQQSKPLDTKKHDHISRVTRERFRSTKDRFVNQKSERPPEVIQKISRDNQHKSEQDDDLDSILKELQSKHKKDKGNKLPFINTKENFNKKQAQKMQKNEKVEWSDANRYETEKQQISQNSLSRNQPRNFTRFEKKDDEVVVKLPGIKRESEGKDYTSGLSKLLTYGFQPQLNMPTAIQPPSKYGRPLGLGNNNNIVGLTPIIRSNLFKQKDTLGYPLKARSQIHSGLKY